VGWLPVFTRARYLDIYPSFPSCTWERHIGQSWALTPYHYYAQPL
jgi:hypothetical protein